MGLKTLLAAVVGVVGSALLYVLLEDRLRDTEDDDDDSDDDDDGEKKGVTSVEQSSQRQSQRQRPAGSMSSSSRRRPVRRRAPTVEKQINPLKPQYAGLLNGVDLEWFAAMFTNPDLPVVLDIGCGEGHWIEAASKKSPEFNFLGVDVQVSAFEATQQRTNGNLGFLGANVCCGDIAQLLAGIPTLRYVLVQYPDFYFQRKHQRRAILSSAFCRAIAQKLDSNGGLLVRSDELKVLDAAQRAATMEHPALLERSFEEFADLNKILAIPTERQTYLKRTTSCFARLFRPVKKQEDEANGRANGLEAAGSSDNLAQQADQ